MIIKVFLFLVQFRAMVISESSTKWLKSNLTILANEGFSISCTATSIDIMSIVKIEHSAPGKNSTTFATNGFLKSPYKERDRYLVDYRRDKSMNTSTVHITFKETYSSDSGVYSCHNLQNSQADPDQFILNVLVPIKEAYIALINLEQFDSIRYLQGSNDLSFHPAFFSSLQPLENGILVEVEEGLGLVCFATSDGHNFKIEATLDDEAVDSGSFLVETLEHPHKMDLVDETQPSGGTSGHYAWKAIVVKQVDRIFNNKNFSCNATASFLPPVIASSTILVEYAPVINCKQQRHVVEMEKKISISCSVLANPAAEVALMDGENLYNSTDIKFTENILSTEEKEVMIMINKVESQHFRSYLIHASNSRGNTTFILTLAKKPGTRAQPVNTASNERILSVTEHSLASQTKSSTCLLLIITAMYFYSGFKNIN